MGQNDESLQKLSLIPDDALDRAGRLLRAELALAFGDKKDALERFRGYLATDPQDHQARFKYAELLSWEKRFNESLAEYSVVVAARPNDVALRRKYAQALSWAGKAEQSIKEFATASEIEKKIGRPDKDGGTSS
jgi:predicted Zn-dependent protease